MKKTFIVIAMLLLVFAISCDGDNPAPGDTPSTSVPEVPDPTPGNTPSTSLPEIHDSAPDSDLFADIPENEREEFVSFLLDYIPAVFQENEVKKLMAAGGTSDDGSVTIFPTHTGDLNTVSISFDQFTMNMSAQGEGPEVTIWGGLLSSGKNPEDIYQNAFSFNMVISIQHKGIFHVGGSYSPTDTTIIVYLNGDPVTSAIPSCNV